MIFNLKQLTNSWRSRGFKPPAILGYDPARFKPAATLAFLVLVSLIASPTQPTTAQSELFLNGPIVATTPAAQDRIILHDLGADPITRRELRFGSGEHHVWDFSPDGCRVLFTLDEGNTGLPTLYTVNLDGTDQQAVINYTELPAEDWGVWEPDWSVRGLIAFTMIRNQPNGLLEHHIAFVHGSGGNPEFYSVTGREFTPQWSPDGEWLAYVSYDERVPGVDFQSTAVPTEEGSNATQASVDISTITEADLWVVSADAETKYRLTMFDTGNVRAPRWSPDGELVGFIYSPSPNNDTFWMVANQQGAGPTQLSFDWNLTLDHTWLPDGSAMLASVRDFQDMSENRLWRIPLVGNADDDGTVYISDNALSYTDYPRFSADGRYLAFRSDYSLIVYDLQTGLWQRLDADAPGNTPPVWTPDTFAGEVSCG